MVVVAAIVVDVVEVEVEDVVDEVDATVEEVVEEDDVEDVVLSADSPGLHAAREAMAMVKAKAVAAFLMAST